MPYLRLTTHTVRRGLVLFVAAWLVLAQPAAVFAQDATGAPEATGAPTVTGTTEEASGTDVCTGAGCFQGVDQGINQGVDQGGLSAEDLGIGDSTVDQSTIIDTRQGADQGTYQGVEQNDLTATNSTTGADSTNTIGVDTTATTDTSVTNTATDTTTAGLTGTTGGNTQDRNTGTVSTTTGDASIGVTQVKNDNTAVLGGSAGLTVTGYSGDYWGNLLLGFGASTANLSNAATGSVQAINEVTGADSTNGIALTTRTEELNEVQNDGQITNLLDLAAITGQNQSNENTGSALIMTGDADVAATLVNLLNTTVINGNLWVSVADIFGNLEGDIYLPDFAAYLPTLFGGSLTVDAGNELTGSGSENAIDVTIDDQELTTIANDATVNTTVTAEAITGQNEANANTGGAQVTTGEAAVSASNITVANTTVEGGTWGLVIVNAFNRWLGFLVGDAGQVRALSTEETIREIEARNSVTGADSDNTIAIDDSTLRETEVTNSGEITNDVTARAITGQNEATRNTGQAVIDTGEANVQATAVNIVNTTVKDGSLFIAVVNIFGDWLGDLFYGGQSLAASAAGSGGTVTVNAENAVTGENSTNSVDVAASSRQETAIDNEAAVNTTLNATVDTGSNRTNRNTAGATIATGSGELALHARTAANLTAIAGEGSRALVVNGLNDTTGAESENTIRATLNDERVIAVSNEANVSTIFGSLVNTGNNVANRNTIGGIITTGDAAADVGISNLINQIVLALGNGGFAAGQDIVADLTNHLTGAFSTNNNDVSASSQALIDIFNSGLVTNLIDLLLNTGGSTANANTVGGTIFTGSGCVAGGIDNDVNRVDTSGGIGFWSVLFDLDNLATVLNDADIDVETGSNETNRNTAPGSDPTQTDGPCAQAQIEPPAPEEPTDEPVAGGVGGAGEELAQAEEDDEPAVAGVVEEQHPPRIANGARSILTRFPVAGSLGSALLVPGKDQLSWQLLLVLTVAMVGIARSFDSRWAHLAAIPLNSR